jgi:hypothetical protein
MIELPNVAIVGVPRSGTTSLYHYLAQHHDVYGTKTKEPKHFSSRVVRLPHMGPGDKHVDSERVLEKGMYSSLYTAGRGHRYRVDGSSEYFYEGQACANLIRAELGDIPIIVILRDPALRAFSAYQNMVRDQRESLTFKQALDAEPSRLRDNWDTMWAYRGAGFYADGLAAYHANFSRVLVLCFEEFRANPISALRLIEEFLGLDAVNDYDVDIQYARSGQARNALAQHLLNRSNPVAYWLRATAKSLLPRQFSERIADLLVRGTSPVGAELQGLWMEYESDVRRVAEMVPFDVDSRWGPEAW